MLPSTPAHEGFEKVADGVLGDVPDGAFNVTVDAALAIQVTSDWRLTVKL